MAGYVTPPTGKSKACGGHTHKETVMIKVKTFSTPIRIFAAARELDELDAAVGAFLAAENATTVYAVSDTTTTDDNGATIGLVRVVAYQAGD
jgi:hypothetical protein